MNLIIYALAIATLFSTLFGGLIVLKFKKSLPYFFAFASGTIIAVAFLDLLPESIELSYKSGIPIRTIMLIIVFSLFVYSFIEKYFAAHHLEEKESHAHILGPIGAGSLIIHSFLDGAAIGIAFQVSFSTGIIIALAVIFHDMTDGINTVAIMLKNGQSSKKAFLFLVMDALAPALGLIVTSLIIFSEKLIALILAFFVGEFTYIGVANLIPETLRHPSKKTILVMALGMLLIAALTSFI